MMVGTIRNELKALLILLAVLGVVLVATTIRGAFIIDEINYMVNVVGLRHGTLMVPGTENMPPSKELLYFDPEPYDREVNSTPVASLAPPLYAPIALPFVFFGWRGLAFLNTLSFLITAVLVFLFVRRRSSEPIIPWLAVALFVLGGYSLEYAQGVWPHMLSVALCMAGVYSVSFVWEDGGPWYPALGGLLIGLASGVREQNIFLAGCLGLTVLLWGGRRIFSVGAYLAGLAVPLFASASVNYYRLGIFFPTPKTYAYSNLVSNHVRSGSWLRPFEALLVKVVDFSTFAWFQDPGQFEDYAKEPATGAFLVAGVVKKALLQSSPWIALGLLLCIVIWFGRSVINEKRGRSLRALSILVLPTLGMLALTGFRMDGLSLNQRYLLELVPMLAIIVALGLDELSIRPVGLVVGFFCGVLSFGALLIAASSVVQHTAILRVPLLLGFVIVLAWILRNYAPIKHILGITLGLCIGWSLYVQTIDIAASRRIRSLNATSLDSLESKIPDHSALFTFWGMQKSAAGPLQLHKDIVILDAWADMGKDAPSIARELLRRQRTVFVEGTGMPTAIVRNIKGADSLAEVMSNPFVLYEFFDKREQHDSLATGEMSPPALRAPQGDE